jgi:hypothetical protein
MPACLPQSSANANKIFGSLATSTMPNFSRHKKEQIRTIIRTRVDLLTVGIKYKLACSNQPALDTLMEKGRKNVRLID